MELKFYKEFSNYSVGDYIPSQQFKSYTHFCVMNNDTGDLIASVGLNQKLDGTKISEIEDYKHYFKCIEQAKLYANSYKMFNLLKEITEKQEGAVFEQAKELLSEITNIDKECKRLLGENSLLIKDHLTK